MRWLVETERLRIRRLRYGDWKDLVIVFTDFEKSRYRNYDSKMPLDNAGVRLVTLVDLSVGGYYAVEDKNSGELLGYISALGFRVKEIGFAFKREYQHHGYAFESVQAMMDYLRKVKKVHRFKAVAALKNQPSVRLLERLGFSLGHSKQMYMRFDRLGKPIMFMAGVFEKECRNE